MCSHEPGLLPPTLTALERELTELACHIHAATCRWLELVAEYDRRRGWAEWGCASCAHWVSWRCGVALVAAREHVRVARRLQALPLVREAFSRGELSYSKVRALARLEDVEREAELLSLARNASASQLERVVRAYRGVVAVERAARGGRPERWVSWSRADDGSLLLYGRLPAEEGALVIAALDAAREQAEADRRARARARDSAGSSATAVAVASPGDSAGSLRVATPSSDFPGSPAAVSATGDSATSLLPGAGPDVVAESIWHAGAVDDTAELLQRAGAVGDSAQSLSGGVAAGDLERLLRRAGSVDDSAESPRGSGALDGSAESLRRAGSVDDSAQSPAGSGALDGSAESLRRAGPVDDSAESLPPVGVAARDAETETPALEAGEARADALLLIADSFLATGAVGRNGGDRHQVVVHVDASTLRGPGRGERCELDGGTPLATATARRLACDAAIVPLLERAGKPVGVGRKTRSIPPALRRALAARDGGCRFPGCTARRFVDAHHIEHWAEGGKTELANLVHLCRHHHRLLHEGGYTLTRTGKGTLTFRRPDGRPIPACPAPPGGRLTGIRPPGHRRPIAANACVPLSGDKLDLQLGVQALIAFAPIATMPPGV